jgi:hypothetical protein
MIRQARTGDTVLVKSREMTVPWWIEGEGVKTTGNKIHWPRRRNLSLSGYHWHLLCNDDLWLCSPPACSPACMFYKGLLMSSCWLTPLSIGHHAPSGKHISDITSMHTTFIAINNVRLIVKYKKKSPKKWALPFYFIRLGLFYSTGTTKRIVIWGWHTSVSENFSSAVSCSSEESHEADSQEKKLIPLFWKSVYKFPQHQNC